MLRLNKGQTDQICDLEKQLAQWEVKLAYREEFWVKKITELNKVVMEKNLQPKNLEIKKSEDLFKEVNVDALNQKELQEKVKYLLEKLEQKERDLLELNNRPQMMQNNS